MSRLVEFMVLLLCISASSSTMYKYSSASPAQIRFAEENKYDNTGPGAKELEAAFNTFSKLEDALLSYFDDPDTKLPEQERIKALTTLYRKGYSIIGQKNTDPNQNEYTKTDLANDVFAPKNLVFDEYPEKASVMIPKLAVPFVNDEYEFPSTDVPEENEKSYANEYAAKSKVSISYNDAIDPKSRYTVYHSRYPAKVDQRHNLHKLHSIKASPVNLAHYSRDTFEPVSQFSYSYAVQGKDTSHYQASPFQDQVLESSQPASSRGVIGYYTYMDAEGKRRTVQYRAPNNKGFRSNLDRYSNYYDLRG